MGSMGSLDLGQYVVTNGARGRRDRHSPLMPSVCFILPSELDAVLRIEWLVRRLQVRHPGRDECLDVSCAVFPGVQHQVARGLAPDRVGLCYAPLALVVE